MTTLKPNVVYYLPTDTVNPNGDRRVKHGNDISVWKKGRMFYLSGDLNTLIAFRGPGMYGAHGYNAESFRALAANLVEAPPSVDTAIFAGCGTHFDLSEDILSTALSKGLITWEQIRDMAKEWLDKTE